MDYIQTPESTFTRKAQGAAEGSKIKNEPNQINFDNINKPKSEQQEKSTGDQGIQGNHPTKTFRPFFRKIPVCCLIKIVTWSNP
jgi:hypothetical protein